MPDYIPTRDADLLIWSANFKALTASDAASYGLTVAQATAYSAKHDAYASALQTASDPSTRTPSAVIAKDVARAALVAEARMLARIVQATPTVSAEQKSDLGLTVRDAEPSPVPPPASAPDVLILSAVGRTLRVRLIDPANPTRRGKPAGVAGASVFSYVGETPPAELTSWTFEGSSSRTSFQIEFPATVAAGAKVWVTAFWFNARQQRGPTATPQATNLPGGSAMAA